MKRVAFGYLCIPIFAMLVIFCQTLLLPNSSLAADPQFLQEQKLVRLEESWSGKYGSSVSMDGDTLVVGAEMWKRTELGYSYGAVFIYYRDRGGIGTWGEVTKIAPTDISAPGFGSSVVIKGDILVVGYTTDRPVSYPPAIYIYYRNQGGIDNWGQVKKITGISGSIAFEGDTLVVGDESDEDNGYRSGAASIFQRNFGGVDNWGLVKKITAGDGVQNDSFGCSVAISGDTIAVGAMQPAPYAEPPSGKAYIFKRNYGGTDNWGEVKKIIPADGGAGDRFGASVAIHGTTLVVSAIFDDDNGSNSGSAYIFEQDSGGTDNWGEVKKIIPADGGVDDYFGSAVAFQGDILIVGVPNDDDNGSFAGSAYVFYRDQGGSDNWGPVVKLYPDHRPTDKVYGFGSSVFILGDNLVVGSPASDVKGFNMGMAYIFERNSGGIDNWGQSKIVFPVDSRYVAGDRFGLSVSADEDSVVVGAYLDDEDGASSGAVYVYERHLLGTTQWGQYRKKYISSTTTNSSDFFGFSVSISSGTIVASAHGDDDNGADSGAAYILERSNEGSDGWGYDTGKKLLPADGAASDRFGYAVAVNGDTAVIGSYLDDDNGSGSGSAYIFQRDQGGAGNWGQVIKLLPDDGAANDYFGFAVAISGSTAAIGAYQDDDNGTNSGSVYIFERDYGGLNNWGQVKKIVTADGVAYDYFGQALVIDSDTLVVGAYGDDDNGSNSGSAYVFSCHQGGTSNWGLVKKILPGDGAASDNFGWSVHVNNQRVAIGARLEDSAGTDAGSVYIFDVNAGGSNNWGEIQKITANDGAAGDNFGDAVSISGDVLVIGASLADEYGTSSGSAYIFSYGSDTDGDGLSDSIEESHCTEANDADSDDDGLSDGDEDSNHNGYTETGETDPCDIDSDNDNVQDGTEVGLTLNDILPDTNQSVFQADENPVSRTRPLNPDSDGDGYSDGNEDANRNGMVDPGETDPTCKMGDVDRNETIELPDAMLAMKGICGYPSGGSSAADINGDGRVGLAEVVYILGKLSESPTD